MYQDELTFALQIVNQKKKCRAADCVSTNSEVTGMCPAERRGQSYSPAHILHVLNPDKRAGLARETSP
jgi:hypothetical protein